MTLQFWVIFLYLAMEKFAFKIYFVLVVSENPEKKIFENLNQIDCYLIILLIIKRAPRLSSDK